MWCIRETGYSNDPRKLPRKPDTEIIPSFFSSGRFAEGTNFFRSGLVSNHGVPMWNYTCPICSNDEYVKAGICDGVFGPNTAGKFRIGKMSCRCTHGYKWTKAQYEYRAAKFIASQAWEYEFVGWHEGFAGSNSRLVIRCKDHGEFLPTLRHFLDGASKCPKCRKTGFDHTTECHLYIIRTTYKSNEGFTGYGITKDLKTRVAVHKRNLKRGGFDIDAVCSVALDGISALRIETEIKRRFEVCPQPVRGFQTEATLYENYSNLICYVHKEIENVL